MGLCLTKEKKHGQNAMSGGNAPDPEETSTKEDAMKSVLNDGRLQMGFAIAAAIALTSNADGVIRRVDKVQQLKLPMARHG
jgi:hypothetical protein